MSWEVLSTQRWASLNSAENSAVKFQQDRSAPPPLQSVAEPSALGFPMLVPQPWSANTPPTAPILVALSRVLSQSSRT